MAETADVQSLEAIRAVRAALLRFVDDAQIALGDVEFDIQRTMQWVAHDQLLHWQGEIRRWEQRLSQAKNELQRKRLARFLDRKPDTSQEERAVRLAETRLQEGYRKVELIRRTIPELQHAVQEYRGQSQALASMLEVDLQKGCSGLDRMLDALEAYLNTQAPRVLPRDDVESLARAGSPDDAGSMRRSLDEPEPASPAATPPSDHSVEEQP